ncbi:MAG TPA: DUF2851 family protein [Sumerlaeia bacterium]|nr:DUF2851 family protein [Sumerlaeia bacterium]
MSSSKHPNDSKEFAAFREEMAREFASLRVGEAVASIDGIPADARSDERLAQCIWFDSLFVHRDLRTDSGHSLEILQPGRWNEEEGPDFRDAKIRIDGRILTGNVEIHLYSSGWRQHRHHLNPEYDSVVLHAYMWPGGGAPPIHDSRGRPVESFEMGPVLFPDLDTIRQTTHAEDYPYQTPSALGSCQPLMCSLDEDYVAAMLDAAGRERLNGKASRYQAQAVGETANQVFYQALMAAMGHKSSKGLFFLLSKRTPLHETVDYLSEAGREKAVLFFQSILFHVAQLAPAPGEERPEADDETRRYIAELREIWAPFAGYFSDRLIMPTRQWTSGVRPANFAHRRIAGVAHLLARWFLDETVAGIFARRVASFDPAQPTRARRQWIRRQLIDPFVVHEPDDFWAWRFTFSSRPAARALKLIGEDRAASIALNALLPLLLVHARERRDGRLEDRVRAIFLAFPPLESNSMVRHMRTRLFGDHERASALLTSEARQQALFQIFASCCNHNESGCEDCYFLKKHENRRPNASI